jgi:hypothetical protein
MHQDTDRRKGRIGNLELRRAQGKGRRAQGAGRRAKGTGHRALVAGIVIGIRYSVSG